GNEQREYWHSSSADNPGSRNLMGLRDPAIDQLVEGLIQADSRAELITYTRALDRVLRAGHYLIPNYHTSVYRVAYWNKFAHPEQPPKYDLGLYTWWATEEGTQPATVLLPEPEQKPSAMLAYIIRRLLLNRPALFGILLINFLNIQAAPGGPVEQMIANLEGFEDATSRISGSMHA